MAVKRLILICDWCGEEATEFDDESEALTEGWVLVTRAKPFSEYEINEEAYCSDACLTAAQ